MSIEPEQALAVALSLEPLKYFPRSAQGLAEVAIVIAETCPTEEQAETAAREILRSHDEWPGMRSFAGLLRRSLPRPAPTAPPPDAPAAAPDPVLAAYQARRRQAEQIWEELPRPEKLARYREVYERLSTDSKWTGDHTDEETKAHAVNVCIDHISWDLPGADDGGAPPGAAIADPPAAKRRPAPPRSASPPPSIRAAQQLTQGKKRAQR